MVMIVMVNNSGSIIIIQGWHQCITHLLANALRIIFVKIIMPIWD